MREARPSGTVTFLFTDIEGSTRRWETDAEAMRSALAAHDVTLATVIAAHAGWLFKHTGDGVCAAFSSPHAAVDAAVEAQRLLGLPVRMGIATGVAELRGDDYFGPALNRAARVMAAGHGGQIVVAASTSGLLDGVPLVDLGEHRLRDLSGTQHLFAVRADGLRTDLPHLRTLDAAPGNLEVQQTSFVGRQGDVAAVVAAVRAHRVVTLTGVGGVGKTRLALQCAAELVAEFPDGVWVVELGPVGDSAAVGEVVATVLGVTPHGGVPIVDCVAESVGGRRLLLVLDNCEHVLDAAADVVQRLLARCEHVRVLATSREGLGVGAEHLWPVPSLAVTEGAASAAVVLFVERAQAVHPAFEISRDADEDAVVEICRRLDGIALAIELAAARMVSMGPAEVRDRLRDRFRLLAGPRRAVGRHQTLRHAVQWSFDLLSSDERRMLCSVSVFAGGFMSTAAAAVFDDAADEYVVLDLLEALVRKSLLSADRTPTGTRFRLLETIRDYAEQELAAAATIASTRDRHAHFFAVEAQRHYTVWEGPRQPDAYAWLDAELANLRVAFRWSTDGGDVDTAATIAAATALVGAVSHVFEPSGWAEELLEAAQAQQPRILPWLYCGAASCMYLGRADDAVRYADAALALLDDPRFDPLPVGFGYPAMSLGSAHLMAGLPDRFLANAAAVIARDGDTTGFVRAGMAWTLASLGRFDEAVSVLDGAVAAAEQSGIPTVIAYTLYAYGTAHAHAHPQEALAAKRRALDIARRSGSRMAAALVTRELAGMEARFGDTSTALDLFDETIDSVYQTGTLSHLGATFAELAVHLERVGLVAAAATMYGAAIRDARSAAIFASRPELPDRLRQTLGPSAFDENRAAGTAMTAAESVRYAHAQIAAARAFVEPA